MSSGPLSKIKPFTPKYIQLLYRKYRKWERFHKRYLVNHGEPSVKNISTVGEFFKIIINPYTNGCVDDVISSDGVWEPNVSKKIKELLPAGGVFVDIGANIGYHSLFSASLHNNSTKVFAFEPQNSIFQMLTQSVALNNFKNIQLFNIGLSDQEGTAELNIFEENKGASSLTQGIKHHSGVAIKQKIEIKTLDSFIEIIPKADVVKIDVEGFEYEVMLGGSKFFNQYRPVLLLEFSPGLYNLRDKNISTKLIKLLKELNYEIYTLEGEPIDLQAWTLQVHEDTDQIDIMCVARK